MNLKKIRSNFPLFSSNTESPLVFLDSAASAQKPSLVIDTMASFYSRHYSAVHRGLYPLAEEATTIFEEARSKVARFINARDNEVVFTKGTTESINLIATAWALNNLKVGDEILLSQVEHHSNLLPWQQVAKKTGAELKFIPLCKEKLLLKPHVTLISSRTKLVAVTLNSNILGNVWPTGSLESLVKQAQSVGARVFFDAAQAVGHSPVDVKKLNADFLAFSAHKMLGPSGIGILYIKQDLHDEVEPYQYGGAMVYDVSYESSIPARPPAKFEAGTPPITAAVGLGTTIDYLEENVNFEELAKHYSALSCELINGLSSISGVTIYSNAEQPKEENHVVSFTVNGVHAHDITDYLGRKNIALRAGHHCAQPLINLLDVDALVRASFAVYTTSEEIQALLNNLPVAIKHLKK